MTKGCDAAVRVFDVQGCQSCARFSRLMRLTPDVGPGRRGGGGEGVETGTPADGDGDGVRMAGSNRACYPDKVNVNREQQFVAGRVCARTSFMENANGFGDRLKMSRR